LLKGIDDTGPNEPYSSFEAFGAHSLYEIWFFVIVNAVGLKKVPLACSRLISQGLNVVLGIIVDTFSQASLSALWR
jgi:hypothetical protein